MYQTCYNSTTKPVIFPVNSAQFENRENGFSTWILKTEVFLAKILCFKKV